MIRIIITMCAALALTIGSAQAADEWGIEGEKKDRFEAKVVDVLCELAGDCPAECGKGTRQLGLLKDDGTLVLAIKNNFPFTGATRDLQNFCGQRVVADGLSIENRGSKFFTVQFVKPLPEGKWQRANRWVDTWAEENGVAPDSKKAQRWFRNDPTVAEIQKREGGLLGIPRLKAE